MIISEIYQLGFTCIFVFKLLLVTMPEKLTTLTVKLKDVLLSPVGPSHTFFLKLFTKYLYEDRMHLRKVDQKMPCGPTTTVNDLAC